MGPLHRGRLLRLAAAFGLAVAVGSAASPMPGRATPVADVVGASHHPTIRNDVVSFAAGGTVVAGRSLVAGSSLRPLVVERRADDGGIAWSRTLTDLAADPQWPVRVLAAGGTAVVAGTARRGASDDGFVRALDADGAVAWTAWIASSDGRRDVVNAAAHGPEGSVVVVGRTEGLVGDERATSAGTDAFVARVDPGGGLAWVRQLGPYVAGLGHVPSELRDVVVAPDGRVLAVAGDRCSGQAWCHGAERDLAVLVLDHAGTLAAVVRRPLADVVGVGGATLTRVVAGPDGPVVVATTGGAATCLHVAGLGWDLVPAWRSGPLLCGPGAGLFGHDGAVAVAPDGRIVVGTASDYGTHVLGATAGAVDLVVAVLAPDGRLLGGVQHGGPSVDRVEAVAIDAAGRVHAVGHAGEGATSLGLPATDGPTGVTLVLELDPALPGPTAPAPPPIWTAPEAAGPVAWQADAPVPLGVSDGPLTGAAGALTLSASARSDLRGPVVHASGTGFIVAGWGRLGAAWDVPHLVVEQRAADGTLAWRTRVSDLVGSPDVPLALDERAGRIVVAGATGGGDVDGFVAALDGTGAHLWTHRLDGGAGAVTRLDDAVVLSGGAVVAVGGTTGTVAATERDDRGFVPVAVRLGADGTVGWTVEHPGPDPRRHVGVETSPDGGLVVRTTVHCLALTPCEQQPAVAVLAHLDPDGGHVTGEVALPLMELLGADPADTYRDRYPWLTVDGQAPHPDGVVLSGSSMRATGERCLTLALVAWDLAPRWAGPRLLCDGADLYENRGAVAAAADGRIVAAVGAYYELDVAGPTAGATDVVAVVLDRLGHALDAVQFGGPATDHPMAVAVLADGSIRTSTTSGAGVTTLGAPPALAPVAEVGTLTVSPVLAGPFTRAPERAGVVGRAGGATMPIGPVVGQPGGIAPGATAVVGGAVLPGGAAPAPVGPPSVPDGSAPAPVASDARAGAGSAPPPATAAPEAASVAAEPPPAAADDAATAAATATVTTADAPPADVTAADAAPAAPVDAPGELPVAQSEPPAPVAPAAGAVRPTGASSAGLDAAPAPGAVGAVTVAAPATGAGDGPSAPRALGPLAGALAAAAALLLRRPPVRRRRAAPRAPAVASATPSTSGPAGTAPAPSRAPRRSPSWET